MIGHGDEGALIKSFPLPGYWYAFIPIRHEFRGVCTGGAVFFVKFWFGGCTASTKAVS